MKSIVSAKLVHISLQKQFVIIIFVVDFVISPKPFLRVCHSETNKDILSDGVSTNIDLGLYYVLKFYLAFVGQSIPNNYWKNFGQLNN